jgi:peptide/nickel transport system substrate-binding protein
MRIHQMATRRLRGAIVAMAVVLIVAGCARRGGCRGEFCGTLVLPGIGRAATLLPVLSDNSLERDIFDQIFLKLADIGNGENTVGDAGFVPQLARSWEWTDPLTLVFHLDPRARWQDGVPVSAGDVAFTFNAYTDTLVNSPARSNLTHIAAVTAIDSLTVAVRFRDRYSDMFYDAVYHMRILPAHLLQSVPRDQWITADFGRAPVGDGPYRFVRWVPNDRVELVADSTFFLGRPHIRRLVWRFVSDFPTAVTQLVAGEVDAIQVLLSSTNMQRARDAGHLNVIPYTGSTYGFLRFNLRANGDSTRPHPILADPVVRRALVLATDREGMAQSVYGGTAKVPPAPISQMWHALWFADLAVPPYDTVQASRLLEQRGWRDSDGDGIRDRGGQKLALEITVVSTSAARKQYAQLLQEQLRAVGVVVTIDEMDNQAAAERLRTGRFDAAVESWVTDPAPSSGIPQHWTRDGSQNYGHYDDPAFDRDVGRAIAATSPDAAAAAWHGAFEAMAQDPPAIFLNAPDNDAAVDQRVADVQIRPDSWWALLRTWRIPPDRLNERDRLGR